MKSIINSPISWVIKLTYWVNRPIIGKKVSIFEKIDRVVNGPHCYEIEAERRMHIYIYIYIYIVMKTPIKRDFCIYHTFKMGPVSYVGPIFIYWARDPIIHGPNINIELKLIINISLINTTLSSHNLILGHKTLVCLAISEPGDTMLNYFIQYIN